MLGTCLNSLVLLLPYLKVLFKTSPLLTVWSLFLLSLILRNTLLIGKISTDNHITMNMTMFNEGFLETMIM
jgi:hypothetical protein